MQQKKVKAKIWTREGLIKLGRIIKHSRESHRLNLRDASQLISKNTEINVAYSTLGAVENASYEPKYNTLAAIAASGLVQRNGKTLTIFDFIKIASEEEQEGLNMDILVRLIQETLAESRLNLREFARECRIPFSDMGLIMQKEQPEKFDDYLAMLAGRITNPNTGNKFSSYSELMEYCNMKKNDLTARWEQSHLFDVNGYGLR